MRFLITGVSGFAGTHLARLLVKEGHQVSGILRASQKGTIGGVNCQHFGDLTEKEFINNIFDPRISITQTYDGIFHLAGKTHLPTCFQYPVETFEVNALGTINICEAIRKYQPDCVLMNCSTGDVYGVNPEGTLISEETSIKPQNPYAVSKAAADMYCNERFKNGFLKGFTVRPFSHTGPGRAANFSISSDAIQIAKIIKGKQEPVIRVGNLKSKRVVMDVRDVVDVYYQLMMRHFDMMGGDLRQGEIYNISGNDLREMGYFLDIMIQLYNLKIKTVIDDKLYRKIDIPAVYPDSHKVREFLDWKPSIPIEKTLKDLVEYWLEKV